MIVFAPHFIGLDAGGARLQLEDQLVCLYSNQALPAIDAWIYKGRSRFNQPMLISRRDGIGPLVRALKRGVTAHFSPDMDLGPRGAEFVPFFGVPAATQPSIIRLAHLTNATVLPMVTLLTPGVIGQGSTSLCYSRRKRALRRAWNESMPSLRRVLERPPTNTSGRIVVSKLGPRASSLSIPPSGVESKASYSHSMVAGGFPEIS